MVVEEAKRVKMDLELLSGEEVEAQLRDVMGQPKDGDLVDRGDELSRDKSGALKKPNGRGMAGSEVIVIH